MISTRAELSLNNLNAGVSEINSKLYPSRLITKKTEPQVRLAQADLPVLPISSVTPHAHRYMHTSLNYPKATPTSILSNNNATLSVPIIAIYI